MVRAPRVFHVVVVRDAQAMYVLALVTQKGGSGKSTLAVGIAVAAMANGERVAIVDADPQGTISKWRERRGHPYPRIVRVADPAGIEGALVNLEAEGIWLTVIDTAATNNALAMRAIAGADLCLIPARPSLADIEAAIPTLIAIRRLNRRFAFVLNQTPPRGCRVSEAATSLNSLGVLALPCIGQRNDHQDALGAGLGVTEFSQEGRASEEVCELWRWILKKLVEGASAHEPHARNEKAAY
ncbi:MULTISPECIES: ParA family protein [Bradyrhizobium]|jgi:chromosome partitioning protein|uniref:ParA family protein n=1 Tax=Bradyrhizobium TaxID=374 RepID=UPI001CD636E8|nr:MULTISPECIES: ParA family protein [Bradyrhizobium]MCP1975548.1 chromosome partitioning protein [Bradyrhizobium elkanii]MCS3482312.1 chromosome partitioning protein [Bradyrhizobium elkanii]MCS3525002.1 chromosome partitioning protein [Bradyrhizobium elkanii]MCS4075786.1 chromosome partitioning protein [Bradyrhizobium elkanii]MCS4084965.1 chromosome partitioning protein [Bradyrhizobium elkanii]